MPSEVYVYLLSVPFRPCGIFALRGLRLSQAEEKLFGAGMALAYGQFCANSGMQPDVHGEFFSLRVNAWRVGTVIKQIAQAYARLYQFRQARLADATYARRLHKAG